MDKKLTKEDIINVAKSCTDSDCKSCPLEDDEKCATNFLNCIIEYMKNEPAPAATGTSSEVSKDTSSTHLDDSTLLDICQEGIEEMAKIALDDYPNEFLTGYIEAFKDNIRRLRGEQSD
ncbi:hypothetical protein DXD23_12825 [Ruminococcus sp. TF12-2]|jgi:hypothetical protein|uniref:hypothetical protein n=1 Tax=Ruminococcus sp. TaxID=41978 RepID=UPI000E52666B|nr:hypothetical protein DXD23_12825 [Ruminococcus sp. TF12-2]